MPRVRVIEAGLPTFDYYHLSESEGVQRQIARVSEQTSIALGPFDPECLTYELVPAVVLRDARFIAVPGFGVRTTVGCARCCQRLSRRAALHGWSLSSSTSSPRLSTEIMLRAAADVVAAISWDYPRPVIRELIGASRGLDGLLGMARWLCEDIGAQPRLWRVGHPCSMGNPDAYIEDPVASRRQTPTDDLISELEFVEDHDRISHSQRL